VLWSLEICSNKAQGDSIGTAFERLQQAVHVNVMYNMQNSYGIGLLLTGAAYGRLGKSDTLKITSLIAQDSIISLKHTSICSSTVSGIARLSKTSCWRLAEQLML
jgi:hypothetical protein